MTGREISAYSFGTARQWQRCLTTGFAPEGSALAVTAEPGGPPLAVPGIGPASGVAADRIGETVWRVPLGDGGAGLSWEDSCCGLRGPYPVDAVVADSPRLLLDRQYL